MPTGCGAADGVECLHDHVRPHLVAAKISTLGNSYRALAPCHPDTTHSLSVGIGDSGLPVWCCFACTKRLGKEAAQIATREALIKDDVSPRCLRLGADSHVEFEQVISGLVFGGETHAHVRLRIAAYLRGYGTDLPRGAELAGLAEDCGVSLREAYKARGLDR